MKFFIVSFIFIAVITTLIATKPLYIADIGDNFIENAELQKNKNCLDACNASIEASNKCVAMCLKENQSTMNVCIQLCKENIIACKAAIDLMKLNSVNAKAMCLTTAQFLERCASECEKYNMVHCKQNAMLCQKAAKLCKEMK